MHSAGILPAFCPNSAIAKPIATHEEEEEITSFQPHQADWMDTTCVKGHRGTQLTNRSHEWLFHQPQPRGTLPNNLIIGH